MSGALQRRRLWLGPVLVWGSLLALLAGTVASAYVPLGPWNTVINMVIAVAKAALVGPFFMHLARSSTLVRLAAATGFVWLIMMFALTASDYLARLT